MPTWTGPAAPTDTDADGMPDAWEQSKGLNPANAADRNQTNLSPEGYTNLEVYLNSLMIPLEGLPGDFNKDARVDGADFLKFQQALGAAYTPADLTAWRANFGEATTTATLTTVAEPTITPLHLLALAALLYARRPPSHNHPV
jgi:hypothetical protein